MNPVRRYISENRPFTGTLRPLRTSVGAGPFRVTLVPFQFLVQHNKSKWHSISISVVKKRGVGFAFPRPPNFPNSRTAEKEPPFCVVGHRQQQVAVVNRWTGRGAAWMDAQLRPVKEKGFNCKLGSFRKRVSRPTGFCTAFPVRSCAFDVVLLLAFQLSWIRAWISIRL